MQASFSLLNFRVIKKKIKVGGGGGMIYLFIYFLISSPRVSIHLMIYSDFGVSPWRTKGSLTTIDYKSEYFGSNC